MLQCLPSLRATRCTCSRTSSMTATTTNTIITSSHFARCVRTWSIYSHCKDQVNPMPFDGFDALAMCLITQIIYDRSIVNRRSTIWRTESTFCVVVFFQVDCNIHEIYSKSNIIIWWYNFVVLNSPNWVIQNTATRTNRQCICHWMIELTFCVQWHNYCNFTVSLPSFHNSFLSLLTICVLP